jgi:hypothetical protein
MEDMQGLDGTGHIESGLHDLICSAQRISMIIFVQVSSAHCTHTADFTISIASDPNLTASIVILPAC